MSFNEFPPEVLVQIFSDLLDVRVKIRLERVSKKFRDCIQDKQSWRRNTTLEWNQFGSELELRAFLSRAKKVTFLSLRGCGLLSKEMVATLWEFDHKLKIQHIQMSPSTSPCPNNIQFVACCLGKFCKSFKTIDFTCCQKQNCDLLNTVAAVLPRCSNLKHLTLRYIEDRLRLSPVEVGEHPIIGALMGLNLETLHLDDFVCKINEHTLAAVFNSAKDHLMHSLHLESTRGDTQYFWFDEFCENLELPAAEAITSIRLIDIDDTDWMDVLHKLPTMMPNLERLVIEEDLYAVENVVDGAKSKGTDEILGRVCQPAEENPCPFGSVRLPHVQGIVLGLHESGKRKALRHKTNCRGQGMEADARHSLRHCGLRCETPLESVLNLNCLNIWQFIALVLSFIESFL